MLSTDSKKEKEAKEEVLVILWLVAMEYSVDILYRAALSVYHPSLKCMQSRDCEPE